MPWPGLPADTESSRRCTQVVEGRRKLALSGSKSDGFGPVITTGEPFHRPGFGPVITTGEPFQADSGRKTTTKFPTPGTTPAAAEAEAFSSSLHESTTSGVNAHEIICSNACCCSPIHVTPTPGPIYSHMHCIYMDENIKTKILIGELVIQPSRRRRCAAGVAAPPLRLQAASATIKI